MTPVMFRDLYGALVSYDGAAVVGEVIDPWLNMNGAVGRDWLAEHSVAANEERFGRRSTDDPDRKRRGDLLLYSLYAFSRVVDLMLLAYQETLSPSPDVIAQDRWLGRQMPAWTIGPLAHEVLLHVTDKLGLASSETMPFDPFLHEIARVTPAAEPDTPITVVETLWPLIRAGDLIIARQGVAVKAGSRYAKPGVADRSTLYWSYWRRHRPTSDGSMGWGGNSQWATDFRRDYETSEAFEFNFDQVDGGEIEKDDTDLPQLQLRRELVMNRSLLTKPRPSREAHLFRWAVRREKT